MDGLLLTALAALVLCGCAALVLTPAARALARQLGVVDRPDGVRKLQQRPTALLGGVAVYGSLLVGLAAWQGPPVHDGLLSAAALCLGLLCAIGVCDDVLGLRAGQKFLAQLIAVAPVVCGGYGITRVGFLGAQIELGWMGPVLTAFWLTACINAINLIDGVDALASTTAAGVALCTAGVSLLAGGFVDVVGCAALIGALAGFLVYNRPPASIYLGDAGSLMVGAALGLLTLRAATGAGQCTSLPLMLMLMAVPLGDTCLAILRRWLSGQGIWRADRGHIHHRLLERGFSVGQLLATVAGVCLLTGGIALLTRWVELEGFGVAALGVLAVALVQARLMGHHEWSLVKQAVAEWAAPTAPAEPPAAPRLHQPDADDERPRRAA
jgi:UDP-GlcNAc:undecaprenyl-phosphate GlcNAc-1-phosphate transferase